MNEQLDRIEIALAALTGKVDEIYISSQKTQKYFRWTLYVTIAAVGIPALLIPLAVPSFLASQSAVLPAGF